MGAVTSGTEDPAVVVPKRALGHRASRHIKVTLSCPRLGSIRVIHGWNFGSHWESSLAAVAVDNPLGIVPGRGQRRPGCHCEKPARHD